ncbi:PilZ domain protein [Planctomycetes bacterium Pan216]|uniref:PilZ domain protein n=1 Tax=Kolteria novifilia TaxID=2527975 RepID=A0A518B562_9BACT|nr:PilZ domain protein [Planctomycetes bacterium Pan216]
MAIREADDSIKERTQALQKWVRRVVADHAKSKPNDEQRRFPRHRVDCKAQITPLNAETLQPETKLKRLAVTKDISTHGLGLVGNDRLQGDLFFVNLIGTKQLLLGRVSRQRQIQGSVYEYGFEIIDRYEAESMELW